jgi:hypothetical protein
MALQKISGVTIDLTSQAEGDVAYFDGTDWVRLAKGDAGDVLRMNENVTAPEWGTVEATVQGRVSGYCGGGEIASTAHSDVIDKFSYTSSVNATDVGNLTGGAMQAGCCGSTTYGYCMRNDGPGTPAGPRGTTTYVERWSFATDGNATNVGTLPNNHWDGPSGHASTTHGYGAGAYDLYGDGNAISKFAFSNEATTTDVGNLTVTAHGAGHAGCSSYDYGGFVFGGFQGGAGDPNTNVIDKFSFSSDGNATDHADLTAPMRDMNGQSGLTHGYAAFGYLGASGPYVSDIQKFPYASQTNATDVGDISFQRGLSSGTVSITHGYSTGGITTTPAKSNRISKNSHVTDGNEVDVANLTVARSHFSGTGTQI